MICHSETDPNCLRPAKFFHRYGNGGIVTLRYPLCEKHFEEEYVWALRDHLKNRLV